jgi:transcriptional regulator with XRE-family HTH domain
MATFPLPLPASKAIQKLGRDISRARRRRRLTQASLAERSGLAVSTVRRIEEGNPKVALEHIARILHVLGEIARLEQLLDTREDEMGLVLMDEALPERVRKRSLQGAL